MYNRYAESARVNWTRNFAVDIDPKHRKEWTELMTPKSLGLILRSITTNYKFVCAKHSLSKADDACYCTDAIGIYSQ
jgi:hypothetical protein